MTCVLDATSVDEFLKEKFHLQSISDMQWRDWAKAGRILKNIKVQSNHTTSTRIHKIIGFSENLSRTKVRTTTILKQCHAWRYVRPGVKSYMESKEGKNPLKIDGSFLVPQEKNQSR